MRRAFLQMGLLVQSNSHDRVGEVDITWVKVDEAAYIVSEKPVKISSPAV